MIFYFNQTAFEAYVTVTWANGTCTLSNGNLSYVAPNTSGSYTFTVEEEGTWTATISSGGFTFTGSTSITESGQSKTINVNCTKYLFKSGTGQLVSWGTDGYSGYGGFAANTAEMWSIHSWGSHMPGFGTLNKIDLTGYSTLHFVAQALDAATGVRIYGYMDLRNTKSNIVATQSILDPNHQYSSAWYTFAMDISGQNGSYYLFFRTGATSSSSNADVGLRDVWLT